MIRNEVQNDSEWGAKLFSRQSESAAAAGVGRNTIISGVQNDYQWGARWVSVVRIVLDGGQNDSERGAK